MELLILQVFKSILFITITAWSALAILIYFFQEKLIFQPHRAIVATPAAIALDYEDLTLTTADGENIHAWWIPHPVPRASLLFLHGNAGNISHRLDSIKLFHQLGLSILIIDYRGYGNSTGKPSEAGSYIDAETALTYLINDKQIEHDDIIIFGRSLGGAVAMGLAEAHPLAALIIESSFTSMTDMGKHYYPYLPIGLLARIKYPSIDRIANIKSPILIIHSKDDEIVPYTHGRQLFAAALKETTTPKLFLDISGGHNEGFLVSGKEYTDGIDHFIADILKK